MFAIYNIAFHFYPYPTYPAISLLKVLLELLSLFNGHWSPLLVGNRKMAARTLPVASLPSGSLERHELSRSVDVINGAERRSSSVRKWCFYYAGELSI